MWKKEETPKPPTAPSTPHPDPGPVQRNPRTPAVSTPMVGQKIRLKGEITGEEDLLIEGQVEGSVVLRSHAVTIGEEGEVKASIVGRTITVKGSVKGNLTASEQIVLHSSATVEGDLTAPRVMMEDGATFRGGIDMGTPSAPGGGTRPARRRPPRGRERASRRRQRPSSGYGRPPRIGTARAPTDVDAAVAPEHPRGDQWRG